jgi:hypothetical protein
MMNILQYAVYNLNHVVAECSKVINTERMKIMALEEQNQLEARYALMTEYWHRLILFNYLGYDTQGIINQNFSPSLVSRHSRIQIYKILARPTLF